MRHHRRTAFTLIELLVVIAIIAILAAILFPVFAQAKVAAKKATAISDMKQQILGILMYGNDYDDMGVVRYRKGFGPANGGSEPSDGLGWESIIQPYLRNSQIITSSLDPRQRYDTPFGLHRRSYGVAKNAFPAVQETSRYSFNRPLKGSRSLTSFPQPSGTVAIGEFRTPHVNLPNFWRQAEYADYAGFDNTRRTKQPPGNKILPQWGFIDNDYNEGAVWSFIDGHAAWKRAAGKTSDGNSSGTEFPGYQHRAATWDANGENFPEWTGGMSCMDDNKYTDQDAANPPCKVPGE
jgi:prepilin-type N-terminal cleavage/methylation domain-containing protein